MTDYPHKHELRINAGNGGYYLPKNREEVQQFINSMEARAQNTLKAVKYAGKLLNETNGQMNLQDIIEGQEATDNAKKENQIVGEFESCTGATGHIHELYC